MTRLDLLQEALRLPAEARAALAAELIDSLEDVKPEEGAEAAWAEEIRRRLTEVDAGKVTPIPWPEAHARLVATARGVRR
jgi:putative addiction module component (TIGR02574 family)